MLSSTDWAAMRADLLAVRDDNAVSIVLRRGSSTLAAQSVRIARAGTSAVLRRDQGGIEQSEQRVLVAGDTTLDIQKGDRFTVGGDLYEVDFVQPNRRAARVAEARVIE